MKFNYLKKKLINLALFTLSLVVCLVLIEGVLVFISTDDNDNYGRTKEFHEKNIRYNEHGYRDYEYSLKKPEGIFRVLVLGDSQTFGHGISDLKDTWVKKLEVKLQKDGRNASIEVLNMSGPGWNSDTHLYELFKNGFKFNPDLVILAYALNDIPFPASVNCNSSDHKIAPNLNILNNSKLVSFIGFRINRFLEKIGEKPSYSDCLNQVYDSVGWEMGKFYLDIIGLALLMKKIHFMVSVIPIIHQLDDDYPLISAHKKLKEFSRQRKIEFLDFYEKGFKNIDASYLRISKTDPHLNQRASDIIANTLLKRLKGLTKYKNLSYFHKAFSLKEILDGHPALKKVDNMFVKTNSTTKLISKSINDEFRVLRNKDQVTYKKFLKEINGDHLINLLETKLNTKGGFIQSEKTAFYPNSSIPQTKSTIFKHPDMHIQTIEKIKLDSKGTVMTTQLLQRKYKFNIEGTENFKRIRLEKNVIFPDPKLLDKWIFQNMQPPSSEHSRAKQKAIIIGLITKNQNIYDTHEDIKIIKNPKLLDKLTDSEISQYFDERSLFQTFLILNRYGAKNYVHLLLKLIEQYKPSLVTINAATRYRIFLQKGRVLSKTNTE